MHIGESTGMDSNSPHLEKINVDASVRLAGETVEGGMPDNGLTLLRQEEALYSRAIVDVPSFAGDRGKTIAEEDVGSDSDMDLD